MNNIDALVMAWLRGRIGDDFKITKHRFSNQDDVYAVRAGSDELYLKVAKNLAAERENTAKLQPYLRVPKVIGFESMGDRDYLLMTALPGKNLVEYVGEWDDIAVVKEFARAVKEFHSLDVNQVFSGKIAPDVVVLHGDMAMPNIICTQPGSAGYIDLGQMSVGAADLDLADALWSLQRNIGPGYGELFLSEYGDFVMTEKVDKALKYRHQG